MSTDNHKSYKSILKKRSSDNPDKKILTVSFDPNIDTFVGKRYTKLTTIQLYMVRFRTLQLIEKWIRTEIQPVSKLPDNLSDNLSDNLPDSPIAILILEPFLIRNQSDLSEPKCQTNNKLKIGIPIIDSIIKKRIKEDQIGLKHLIRYGLICKTGKIIKQHRYTLLNCLNYISKKNLIYLAIQKSNGIPFVETDFDSIRFYLDQTDNVNKPWITDSNIIFDQGNLRLELGLIVVDIFRYNN